ncbi:MAG: hypothetical protein LBI99_05830, partial [Propionibacteriaceae bacterium]|nr:hypothetical protein [Propionibacteriaceae bacterium]
MKLRVPAVGALAAALLMTALSSIPAAAAPYAADSLLPNQGSGAYDVQHYDIDLACVFAANKPSCLEIDATTTIDAVASQQLAAFDLDFICRNGSATAGLGVTAVTVDGAPASFQCVNNDSADRHKLSITPAAPVSGDFTVAISYLGKPEKYRFVAGFTMDEGWMPVLPYGSSPADGGAVGIGQPNGNITWFPHNDTPLDKATYTTQLTVPNQFKGVGIGELSAKSAVGSTATKWVWTESMPTPSFLAVAAIGEFNEHVSSTTVNWTDVNGVQRSKVISIRAYGDPQDESSLTGGAAGRIAVIKEILQWGSERFGEYQPTWAGYIQKYVGAGWALEILGRPFYSSPGHMYDAILVHEFAHQWAGDSVSVKDWKDLWLAEGFATYAEWLWIEDHGGATAA